MVATKRSPGKRPTSSGRGRGPSSKAKTKATSASRKPRGKAAPPPQPSGIGATLLAATEGHRADLAGLCLIALGIVCGLGIYADRAGVVGHGLALAAATSVGPLQALAPVILVVAGVLLVRGRPTATATPDEATTGADPGSDPDAAGAPGAEARAAYSLVRRSLGAVVLVLAVLGLLDLTRGAPDFGSWRVAIAHAGGFVGVAVGQPLRSALSSWGAVSLLVLLGLAGLILLTGVTLRRAAGATADGVRPAGSAARRALGSMFRLEAPRPRRWVMPRRASAWRRRPPLRRPPLHRCRGLRARPRRRPRQRRRHHRPARRGRRPRGLRPGPRRRSGCSGRAQGRHGEGHGPRRAAPDRPRPRGAAVGLEAAAAQAALAGPARSRSTASSSRRPAAPSSTPSPSTASRPASWA